MLGQRTLLAHGVWLDPAELELIAERGATVVTNPVANMKLAVGGVFPLPGGAAARASRSASAPTAPAPTTRSTSSPTSSSSPWPRSTPPRDPTVLEAAEAWAIATGACAALLGAGQLAVGEPADFLLLRRDSSSSASATCTPDLVYAASGSIVDTTVVAGRRADARRRVARAAPRWSPGPASAPRASAST